MNPRPPRPVPPAPRWGALLAVSAATAVLAGCGAPPSLPATTGGTPSAHAAAPHGRKATRKAHVAKGHAAARAATAFCVLGATVHCHGLKLVGAHTGDGLFTAGTVGGKPADIFSKNTTPGNNPVSYLYFQLPRASRLAASSMVHLKIQYYDSPAKGQIGYNYDSTITSAPVHGAYAGTTMLTLAGKAVWNTVDWKLTKVHFARGENNGADFRLAGTVGTAVHRVTVSLT